MLISILSHYCSQTTKISGLHVHLLPDLPLSRQPGLAKPNLFYPALVPGDTAPASATQLLLVPLSRVTFSLI